MFILDRVTGKPVFGVKERPVARAMCRAKSVLSDAADSGEAARRSRAISIDQGRYRDGGGHHARTCRKPARICGRSSADSTTTVRSRTLPYHAEGREYAAGDHLSRIHRRRELGRHRDRSEARLHLREHQGHVRCRLDGRRTRNTRRAIQDGIEPYIRERARRASAVFSAPARDADGKHDRQLALLQTTMGPTDRGQRRAPAISRGRFRWA